MATITWRSWSIIWSGHGSQFFAEWATIVPRSSDDRATIARLSLLFVDLDPPSDEESMAGHDRPSDGDWTLPMCPRGASDRERSRPFDDA